MQVKSRCILRVSEDPEKVFPDDDVSAHCRVEVCSAEEAFKHQHEQSDRKWWESEDDQCRCNERCPCEKWHPHKFHSWRTHIQNRDQEVDSGHKRTKTRDLKSERIEVDPVASGCVESGAYSRPPCVRCRSEEPAQVEHDASEEEQPKAERVNEWERDVTCPDLKRCDRVHETE